MRKTKNKIKPNLAKKIIRGICNTISGTILFALAIIFSPMFLVIWAFDDGNDGFVEFTMKMGRVILNIL